MTDNSKDLHKTDNRDALGQAWSRMVDCIVHDLTTPFAILRMIGMGLEEKIPSLIEGYQLAVKNGLIESKFKEDDLKYIEKQAVPEISSDIKQLSDFLSLLYPYKKKLFFNSPDIKLLSIQACIQEVLKKFPFPYEEQKKLLHIKNDYDFTFAGAPFFIEQLLSNLLLNALYYINSEGKGEITIWAEEKENYNALHFKDTAKGMNEEQLSRVFSRFFTKRDDNIVPGLGFCRLALLQQGGDVLCHSVNEEYTDFIVMFPK